MTAPGLREVSRQAVRARIARTAEELFVAKGFEETTVDEIAAAVGMSQRTFFRYFTSKDEVVLDTYDRIGIELLARLTDRPLAEGEWESLRRAFDLMTEHFADPVERDHGIALQRIVEDSPGLLAAYLRQLDRVQQRLTEELVARAGRRVDATEGGAGATGPAVDRVVLRAMVGAAFACVQAAATDVVCRSGPVRDDEFAVLLDRAMDSLRPAGQPRNVRR